MPSASIDNNTILYTGEFLLLLVCASPSCSFVHGQLSGPWACCREAVQSLSPSSNLATFLMPAVLKSTLAARVLLCNQPIYPHSRALHWLLPLPVDVPRDFTSQSAPALVADLCLCTVTASTAQPHGQVLPWLLADISAMCWVCSAPCEQLQGQYLHGVRLHGPRFDRPDGAPWRLHSSPGEASL